MEYKGFEIKRNASYIQIHNHDGKKIYISKIFTNDDEEFYKIGKNIIDCGIEIINGTNKTEWMAFQSMSTLDENNNFYEYKVSEKGIEKKQALRKKFKNYMLTQFIVDLILSLIVAFSIKYVNDSVWMMLCIFEITLVALSAMGFGAASSKKDFYKLDEKDKHMYDATAIANGNAPSGYGAGFSFGPRGRYVTSLIVIRIIAIILLVDTIFGSLLPTIIICFNFGLIVFDVSIMKIVKAYNRINEDGISDFHFPR